MVPMNSQAEIIHPLSGSLHGHMRVPGDKSLSHRAVILAAMAPGTSKVSGLADASDVRSTIEAMRALGAKVSLEKQADESLVGTISGWGNAGPYLVNVPINCGNSGTTARLLMGALAGFDCEVTLDGDESLRKRPMARVIEPLSQMGAQFSTCEKTHLPVRIKGTSALRGIDYSMPVASAQVKSALLLAGTRANGITRVSEPYPSRNHTELMLASFGVELEGDTTAGESATATPANTVRIAGHTPLSPATIHIPGDASSAAFICCAALLHPNSEIEIEQVGLNETRIAFVHVLARMGADISVKRCGFMGCEPYGNLKVRYTQNLQACEVCESEVPALIDELPVLCLLAALAQGISVFHGVGELRVKESNRLDAIVQGLNTLGVKTQVKGDTLYVEGRPELRREKLYATLSAQAQIETSPSVPLYFDSQGDHRLAMCWALVGLLGIAGAKEVFVEHFDSVRISYPNFLNDMKRMAK